MLYIAKMATRYPDYHGSGYYNFLMDTDQEVLVDKVREYSHDYRLVNMVKTRHKSIDTLLKQYRTKDSLNRKYFEV